MVEPVFNENLTAPINKGDVIGKAVIYLADEQVSTVNILAVKEVPKGWIFSKIGIPNSIAIVIIAVLSVILIFIIVVSALRSANKAKARARRNQRIKEMARKQIEQERSAEERNWPYR